MTAVLSLLPIVAALPRRALLALLGRIWADEGAHSPAATVTMTPDPERPVDYWPAYLPAPKALDLAATVLPAPSPASGQEPDAGDTQPPQGDPVTLPQPPAVPASVAGLGQPQDAAIPPPPPAGAAGLPLFPRQGQPTLPDFFIPAQRQRDSPPWGRAPRPRCLAPAEHEHSKRPGRTGNTAPLGHHWRLVPLYFGGGEAARDDAGWASARHRHPELPALLAELSSRREMASAA